jgi:mRNA interferase MazF
LCLGSVVCVPLTSNLTREGAPGNRLLTAKGTGLPKDPVANASQLVAVNQVFRRSRISTLSPKRREQMQAGIDVVPGR